MAFRARVCVQVQRLQEKITILALVELLFSKPAHDRTLGFAEIAEKARWPRRYFARDCMLYPSTCLPGWLAGWLAGRSARLFAYMWFYRSVRARQGAALCVCCVLVCFQAQVPLEQVEILLMKTLSLKLMRGVIDQVDQTVCSAASAVGSCGYKGY